MTLRLSKYPVLLLAFAIYAGTSYFTRSAAAFPFLSRNYLLYIAGAVLTMGLYALLWQQIIKRMPVSDAYMFKGTSILFIFAIAVVFFGETINWKNIAGALLVILGIALYAKG